jgi:hypothetical protein
MQYSSASQGRFYEKNGKETASKTCQKFNIYMEPISEDRSSPMNGGSYIHTGYFNEKVQTNDI